MKIHEFFSRVSSSYSEQFETVQSDESLLTIRKQSEYVRINEEMTSSEMAN